MLRKLLMMVALLALPAVAFAGRVPLDPQTRLHAGLSLAGGPASYAPALGVELGFDARMTRILSLDLAGFASPGAGPEMDDSSADPAASIFMRHGLFVAPGLRIPHRASEGLSWDVVFRGGFGGVWWTDVASLARLTVDDEPLVGMDAALLGGVDLVLRKKAFGARITAKAFGFRPYSQTAQNTLVLARPQGSVELFYQW